MFDDFAPLQPMPLTLVTEQLIVHGSVRTRRKRVTDVFNEAEQQTLVLTDVAFYDLQTGDLLEEGATAQVALDSVLFAHANAETGSAPEMRTTKRATKAKLHIPPFTIEGEVHLPLEPELHLALDELQGRYVPVTNASYRSTVGNYQVSGVPLVVVNHSKAHILIPAGTDWQAVGWEMPGASPADRGGW